jgi:hypothetical protein
MTSSTVILYSFRSHLLAHLAQAMAWWDGVG